MTNCKYITKNGRCGLKGSYAYRHGCFGEDMCKCREPLTNADRIRSMNDEELAEFIDEISGFQADYLRYKGTAIINGGLLDWLRQHAEKEAHQ